MNPDLFKASLTHSAPPSGLSNYLLALWYDAKVNWHKAHEIIQDIEDDTASWIHAYLHRKEGDKFNAGYWYSRAGRTMPDYSLEREWEEIAGDLT